METENGLTPEYGDRHALQRTSPKGENFIGVCMKCGKDNLPYEAALDPCPNPSGMTEADAVLEAIDGGSVL